MNLVIIMDIYLNNTGKSVVLFIVKNNGNETGEAHFKYQYTGYLLQNICEVSSVYKFMVYCKYLNLLGQYVLLLVRRDIAKQLCNFVLNL